VPTTPALTPQEDGFAWIEQLSDEQCKEIFWLYVDPPEPFLARFPAALLGEAMRYALRTIAATGGLSSSSDTRAG
jgi:hypothetical protein